LVIVILVVGGVLAISAVCVCAGVIWFVYPATQEARRGAEVDVAKTQIGLFESALQAYRLDNGEYPTTEQGLTALRFPLEDLADQTKWRGPYVTQEIPLDPWGSAYQYELITTDTFRISSMGPDGMSGTDDDIDNG
jgi:general secretion pathway protein G